MSRRELESLVVRRAWEDDRFRRRLLRNPRRTIEWELRRVTGGAVRLDRGVVVYVHEEMPGTLHLVLPARPRRLARPPRNAMLVFWGETLQAG